MSNAMFPGNLKYPCLMWCFPLKCKNKTEIQVLCFSEGLSMGFLWKQGHNEECAMGSSCHQIISGWWHVEGSPFTGFTHFNNIITLSSLQQPSFPWLVLSNSQNNFWKTTWGKHIPSHFPPSPNVSGLQPGTQDWTHWSVQYGFRVFFLALNLFRMTRYLCLLLFFLAVIPTLHFPFAVDTRPGFGCFCTSCCATMFV